MHKKRIDRNTEIKDKKILLLFNFNIYHQILILVLQQYCNLFLTFEFLI